MCYIISNCMPLPAIYSFHLHSFIFYCSYLKVSLSYGGAIQGDSWKSILHGARGFKAQLWTRSLCLEYWSYPIYFALWCPTFLGRSISLFIHLSSIGVRLSFYYYNYFFILHLLGLSMSALRVGRIV